MARDNTWTFTAEEVAQIKKLPKRQFKLGAGNICTGYFDDANSRFYECREDGELTGRVGSAKKQTTIVVPAANGGDDAPPSAPEKKEASRSTESPTHSTDTPSSGTAETPDWRELKRQEEERLKAERLRERSRKSSRSANRRKRTYPQVMQQERAWSL